MFLFSAASFVTIGEPDIALHKEGNTVSVEIQGLDIYDPIKDEVKPRNVHDIAYWMVDEDYDGSNFVVKKVFFCGGDKTEFFASAGVPTFPLNPRPTPRQCLFRPAANVKQDIFVLPIPIEEGLKPWRTTSTRNRDFLFVGPFQ